MTKKEIKLSEILVKNYKVTFSDKEIDFLLDVLPMITVSLNQAFDVTDSLDEKVEIDVRVRRIKTILEKITQALN